MSGRDVDLLFNNESGCHVIQRVPPTERNGRVQTSCISVVVLSIPEKIDYKLLDKDLKIGYTIGTGPGGQHRNNTKSCVRVLHIPTNICVVIDGRDQHSNKRQALEILSVKVKMHLDNIATMQYNKDRRDKMGNGARGDKIRTYNFVKSRAVDHRTNKKTSDINGVINKGKFELLK